MSNISQKKKWFITFIDDYTHVWWVYLLKKKSEVAKTFKDFHSMIQNQYNTNIQIFHTNNGKEYFNFILGEFFSQKRIIQQSTYTNTPQQNGIAARKNRHLLEVAKSLMFNSNVPKHFWGDAILTSYYLINPMPT